MDFRTDITLGLKSPLMPPLMNGGGCIKTVEQVREAARSLMGAVVIGSFTVLPRDGNPGNVFWVGEHEALNSLGMPNGGIPYLEKHLPEMVSICHDAGKPLIVNVAGFNTDEYIKLTKVCVGGGADAVELNFGCPNVVTGQGDRKPIPSNNVLIFENILNHINAFLPPSVVLWVKVSYNPDIQHIKALAKLVARYSDQVKAVTVMNTVPNCMAVNMEGIPRINVGLAGLSGPAIKSISLGQVWQWKHELHPREIAVIGVGGISHGEDICDYMQVGASAFQVTTALLKGGNVNFHVFDRLAFQFTK